MKQITYFNLCYKISLGLTVVFFVVCSVRGLWSWAWGVAASFIWLTLNSYLISLLLRIVAESDQDQKKKVMLICFIKFPVLYLIGLWLLIWPEVALEGILMGFTGYLLVLGGVFAWIKGLKGKKAAS